MAGGGLLGALLGPSLAPPDLLPARLGHGHEAAGVRRALLLVDAVDHDVARARELLLQVRLEVDRRAQRLLHLVGERRDHRGGHALVAEGEEGGADHGLADRGHHAVALEQRGGGDPGSGRRGSLQALRQPELARNLDARLLGDGLGAHLGQLSRAVALEARVQVLGYGQAEHGVPEEGEPLVGVLAPVHPGGMRDREGGELLGKALEQGAEARTPGWRGIGAHPPGEATSARGGSAGRPRRATRPRAGPACELRGRRSSRTSRTRGAGASRAWHCGHSISAGAEILCWARRLEVRACDWRCLGTAMGRRV